MATGGVDKVIPGNPIYYDPKRVRRREQGERQHQDQPRKKKKGREGEKVAGDKVDTYA